MAKRTETIYKCDICGKESKEGRYIEPVQIPYHYMANQDVKLSNFGIGTFDLCPVCLQNYVNVVDEHFAGIGFFGGDYKVKIKYEQ